MTPPILAFGMPGMPEWTIILLVVLVFFGNRIPGVARSLGSGINEFKKGLRDGEKGDDEAAELGPGKDGQRIGDGEG